MSDRCGIDGFNITKSVLETIESQRGMCTQWAKLQTAISLRSCLPIHLVFSRLPGDSTVGCSSSANRVRRA
jgi:hypothetical protein